MQAASFFKPGICDNTSANIHFQEQLFKCSHLGDWERRPFPQGVQNPNRRSSQAGKTQVSWGKKAGAGPAASVTHRMPRGRCGSRPGPCPAAHGTAQAELWFPSAAGAQTRGSPGPSHPQPTPPHSARLHGSPTPAHTARPHHCPGPPVPTSAAPGPAPPGPGPTAPAAPARRRLHRDGAGSRRPRDTRAAPPIGAVPVRQRLARVHCAADEEGGTSPPPS